MKPKPNPFNYGFTVDDVLTLDLIRQVNGLKLEEGI